MFTILPHESELYRSAVNLRYRLLREPLELAFTEAELLAEADQQHFALVREAVVIACVTAIQLSETRVKLRQMAVETEFQGQGFGGKLITATELYLSDQGIQGIELNARETAIGFYDRLGYQAEGPRFIEISIEHQKMVKTLRIQGQMGSLTPSPGLR